MSKSGQEFIAATEGTQYTMYAVLRSMGQPLTAEQKAFQAYLESKYPPEVIQKEWKDCNFEKMLENMPDLSHLEPVTPLLEELDSLERE